MKKHYLIATLALLAQTAFSQYTKLLDFDGAGNGRGPWGHFVSDGTYLYGMAELGGANNLGTIFKIKPDGTGYAKLLDFAGLANGALPRGSLFYDGTYLFGMTYDGGVNDVGCIFKIKPDGTGYLKILDFDGGNNGANPEIAGALISDGTYLYGMTTWGGTGGNGTIFRIKPDGTSYLKLMDFNGTTSGRRPFGALVSDGAFLYGMTTEAGANNYGTIFKIKHDGTGYLKLADFGGTATGHSPYGSLRSDGTYLYGMTHDGGANGKGTVFKIMNDGTNYSTLHDFAGSPDGAFPLGSLISNGAYLYGMTSEAGTLVDGTIFRIKPDGTDYSILYNFLGFGSSEASFPRGSLSTDGTNLYGTTNRGGTNDFGVAFKYGLATSIEDPNEGGGMVVYPNPATDHLTIKIDCLSENATVNLYDMTGAKVHSQLMVKRMCDIDLRKYSPGLYLIRLNIDQEYHCAHVMIR